MCNQNTTNGSLFCICTFVMRIDARFSTLITPWLKILSFTIFPYPISVRIKVQKEDITFFPLPL